MKTIQHFSPYNGLQWEPNGSRSKRQFQSLLYCSNLFIKMNKSFPESFGSFNERNEQIDLEKDLFILMNELEQESHRRASQNRARRAFEFIKLKLCYLFIKWVIVLLDKTVIHRLESFKTLWTVCSLHWNCVSWTVWFPLKSIICRKMLECFHQKP